MSNEHLVRRLVGNIAPRHTSSGVPDCPQRKDLSRLEQSLRQAEKGGVELRCSDCETNLFAARFTVAHLTRIDASVFDIVSAWWRSNFPNRASCVVRALGTKTLVVDCPYAAHRATSLLWLLLVLLVQVALLFGVGYAVFANFLTPYWLWCAAQAAKLYSF